jgi:hypothetical protein
MGSVLELLSRILLSHDCCCARVSASAVVELSQVSKRC